jgi:hypothetical protein
MLKFHLAVASALLAITSAMPAQASLIGDTVNCTSESAPGFVLNCNPSSAQIGVGEEFVVSGFLDDLFSIDLSERSVTIRGLLPSGVIFLQGDRVTIGDLDWIGDPSATLVGIKNFSSTILAGAEASDIAVGPDSLSIDLDLWDIATDEIVSFDLVKKTTVVPLPASAFLLLSAFGGIAAFGRRRAGK